MHLVSQQIHCTRTVKQKMVSWKVKVHEVIFNKGPYFVSHFSMQTDGKFFWSSVLKFPIHVYLVMLNFFVLFLDFCSALHWL